MGNMKPRLLFLLAIYFVCQLQPGEPINLAAETGGGGRGNRLSHGGGGSSGGRGHGGGDSESSSSGSGTGAVIPILGAAAAGHPRNDGGGGRNHRHNAASSHTKEEAIELRKHLLLLKADESSDSSDNRGVEKEDRVTIAMRLHKRKQSDANLGDAILKEIDLEIGLLLEGYELLKARLGVMASSINCRKQSSLSV
ncbi:hypothetical protein OPV22_029219 [Ensete ventricosum]|uniref:Uncharacterized protein n=1 Tax=Ensete ventricosum TaxID=4639 RepID=A0AAV8P4T7_ENSVE|nr:hypothetical protein OPV22_029219 [Ensete ventricosum]